MRTLRLLSAIGLTLALPVAAHAAAADFNNDGFDDLAIGIPAEDIGAITGAGAVNLLLGSAAGLTAAGDQFWHQDVAGVLDTAEAGDQFGDALAAGDFNGDGFADLAIGAHFESVGAVATAGAVNILRGCRGRPDRGGQPDLAAGHCRHPRYRRGESTSSAARWPRRLQQRRLRRSGDRRASRVRSAPLRAPGRCKSCWARRSASPTSAISSGAQNSAGILDVAETDDAFGAHLAVGDFNDDGFADLAIGAHQESVGALATAGAVQILFGSAAGLTSAGNQLWSQDSPGVLGVADADDEFGRALATADFNQDGFDDLAIGVPREDRGGCRRRRYGQRAAGGRRRSDRCRRSAVGPGQRRHPRRGRGQRPVRPCPRRGRFQR